MNYIGRRNRKHLWTLLLMFTGVLCSYVLYWIYDNAYPARYLKEIIQDEPCNETLGRTLDENMEKIKSYPFQTADKYMKDLMPITNPEIIITTGYDTSNLYKAEIDAGMGHYEIETPAIVSGASSNQIHEVVRMFETLNRVVRPVYPTMKIHFFDLGLTSSERTKVQLVCNCEIIDFPFERFPPHVKKLNSYCWKPLAIALMLQKYQFILWMDSSIQIQTSDLNYLFRKAKEKGVMAKYNHFLLASHTIEDTFKFLQETPCVFRDSHEFSTSLVLFHSGNDIIRNYLIKPWVACALIEDCQRTHHDELKLFPCKSHVHYHACHRYDQSVFSLLLYRIFSKNYKDFDIGSSVAKWCRENECNGPP